jgi:hypothetical protein
MMCDVIAEYYPNIRYTTHRITPENAETLLWLSNPKIYYPFPFQRYTLMLE